MSNFWDSVMVPVETAEVVAVETAESDFWARILGVKSKPVQQSKPTAVKGTAKARSGSLNKTLKAVAEAGKVYETVEGLVVPAEDCIHHFMIPTDTAWAIGTCKKCNGERWFNNRFTESSTFNTSLTPTVETGSIAEDADIRDITTAYNAAQDSIEESE